MSYSTRVLASSLLMVLSFVTVGYFYPVTWIQLIGVSFSAFQGGLGEASFLALASFYDTPRALTAWSSGTGFAGIFGYAWVFFFRFALGLSLRATLMMACLLALAWLLTFFVLLTDPLDSGYGDSSDISTTTKGLEYSPLPSLRSPVSPTFTNGTISEGRIFVGRHRNGDRGECRESWGGELYLDAPPNSVQTLPSLDVAQGKLEGKQRAVTMTARERMYFTLSLWRFMVPLTLVYFAEVRRRCASRRTFAHVVPRITRVNAQSNGDPLWAVALRFCERVPLSSAYHVAEPWKSRGACSRHIRL